jgi:hypothetical protein
MRRTPLSFFALWVLLLLFAAAGPRLTAQTAPRFPFAAHPEPTAVYADSTVPRIDLWIPADTLQVILSDVTSDREWRARFRWQGNGLRDSVGLVGFRLKGNTSRYSGKKSFKISFNTFTPGTRWQGVKDLNLNGEHNDPSIARARASWILAQRMGVAAARVNHVALYINGSYFGVYANVEHINDDYVERRYGTDDGNLYKCLYPAPLQFLSTNPNAYKFVSGGRRAYELKTNTEADDYSDLARFIQVLNQTPNSQLECALDTLLDVNEYLLTLALEISLGHWDDYAVNNNNYYLYRSPHDGRFHFLLYDLDNTMGIDWFGTDWTSKDVYQWGNTGYPLYGRLMANASLRQRFTYYLQAVNTALYAPDFRQKSSKSGTKSLPTPSRTPTAPRTTATPSSNSTCPTPPPPAPTSKKASSLTSANASRIPPNSSAHPPARPSSVPPLSKPPALPSPSPSPPESTEPLPPPAWAGFGTQTLPPPPTPPTAANSRIPPG